MRPIDADYARGRLISAGRAIKGASDSKRFTKLIGILVDRIDAAPTLDYAPVRHAEWKEGYCSKCGAETTFTDRDEAVYDYDWEENLRYSHTETYRTYHETPYCPLCGALMDGGKRDG
jgi:hypothetical protein